jgi:hypothetical protein
MHRALLVVSLLFAVGCYTEADVGYAGPGYYAAGPAPAMEVVAPGVQVVAVDYDYPVFFSDGLYYRYYGGMWYSSRVYTGGWGVAYNVPMGVRGIDRPYAYAHYRGGGGYGGPGYRGGPAYRGAPGYRENGGMVRDHREAAPAYRPAPAARGPVVRDHRH